MITVSFFIGLYPINEPPSPWSFFSFLLKNISLLILKLSDKAIDTAEARGIPLYAGPKIAVKLSLQVSFIRLA